MLWFKSASSLILWLSIMGIIVFLIEIFDFNNFLVGCFLANALFGTLITDSIFPDDRHFNKILPLIILSFVIWVIWALS